MGSPGFVCKPSGVLFLARKPPPGVSALDARGKVSGTRFLCKKPVPEPSGKNSKWLAVYQR